VSFTPKYFIFVVFWGTLLWVATFGFRPTANLSIASYSQRAMDVCTRDDFFVQLTVFVACTSCCISHWPSQWERANFDTAWLRNHSTDFDEVGMCNYILDVNTHANPCGAATTWVVWANSSLSLSGFCPCLFYFFISSTGVTVGPILTVYTSCDVFTQGRAF